MKKFTLLTVAASVLAFPAVAQTERTAMPRPTRDAIEKQLAHQFAAIDSNKDGFIVQSEIDAHRASMKSKWEEKRTERRDAHFAAMDSNKDGQISKAEFDAFHAARADKRHSADHKHKAATAGDKDRKGAPMGRQFRGAKPMPAMMSSADMLARLDTNKDGKISLAEFSAPALSRFDAADTNKDGVISDEERRAGFDKRREKMKDAHKAGPVTKN